MAFLLVIVSSLLQFHSAIPGCIQDSQDFNLANSWLSERGLPTLTRILQAKPQNSDFLAEMIISRDTSRVFALYEEISQTTNADFRVMQGQAMLNLEIEPRLSVRDICFWSPKHLLTLKRFRRDEILLSPQTWQRLSPPNRLRVYLSLANRIAQLFRLNVMYAIQPMAPFIVLRGANPRNAHFAGCNSLRAIPEGPSWSLRGLTYGSHAEFMQAYPKHNFLQVVGDIEHAYPCFVGGAEGLVGAVRVALNEAATSPDGLTELVAKLHRLLDAEMREKKSRRSSSRSSASSSSSSSESSADERSERKRTRIASAPRRSFTSNTK